MSESKNLRFKPLWALVAVAIAIGAYWYWSPFWAMHQMAQAAEKQDADAFNSYVDYSRLRDSLKGQFQARLGANVAATAQDKPFAGLGTMLGMALVNQMVDAMVRPEFVMRAMQEGKLRLERERQAAPPPAAPASVPDTARAENGKPKLVHERKGVDKVVTYIVDPKRPDAPRKEQPSWVFERNGFASWKLTELRLPETP
jgi:hypothetical protein